MTAPEAIAQYAKMLRQLATWLEKAKEHATAKGFDANVLVVARLAPDMYTLARQVASACDAAKFAAAYLSGTPAPKNPDTETTIAELEERIRVTIAFLEGIGAERYAAADEVVVKPGFARGKSLPGAQYLRHVSQPNFYFHLCMAYAILRHNGVPLGKNDYLGPIPFTEG